MHDTVPERPPDLGDGRYTLTRHLGSGGAAEVWQAWDTQLDVERAIKILTVDGSRRATLRRRLRAEAKVLAQLNHPHVLRIVDIGQQGGRDFLVMDFLPGGSLADVVTRDGPMDAGEAVTRLLEVLSALAAAHGKGIVHRDVKPQNVLLTADGRAVLADFGIALVEEGDRRTRTGVAMGSFAFMPPEQRMDAKRVGPTADLYAAGATLYWLVTGRNPVDLFAADPDHPRFAGLPPALAEAIAWATRYEVEDRPQDAAAWAERLRALAPEVALTRVELDPARFPAPSSTLVPAGVDAAEPTTPLTESSSTVSGPTWMPDGGRLGVAAVGFAILMLAGAVLGAILIIWAPVKTEPVVVQIIPAVSASPLPDDAWIPAPALRPGTRRAAPPPKPPSQLAARWSGAFDGHKATVTLSGPATGLTGTVAVSYDGNTVSSQVRGFWDPERGLLRLEDTHDAADAGRYEARYAQGRLEGTFRGRYRDVVLPFTFRPEAR